MSLRKFYLLLVLFIPMVLPACQQKEAPITGTSLPYKICDMYSIPPKLKDIIIQKRETPFELTYQSGEYLYIVIGYGQQDICTYQIVVDTFILADQTLYVDTTLSSGDDDFTYETYPVIILKCINPNVPVVFI